MRDPKAPLKSFVFVIETESGFTLGILRLHPHMC